jgi:outer membrane protein
VFTGFSGNAQEAVNPDFVVGRAEDQVAGQRSSCESQNALSARLTSPLPGYPRDCSTFVLTEEQRRAILASNNVFPFDFDKNPLSVGLQVSIPVFNGFARERQVAQANQAADDAEHDRRAEELRLRTAVTQAYDNLGAAYRIVQLEERNRALAEDQLQAEQRRYALGSVALLELLDAQTTLSTADQAWLTALYDFHWNLIRLEAAVGQPLRPE